MSSNISCSTSRTSALLRTTTTAILLMFSLLLVVLAVVPVTAQYQWERQGPFSVGNDLKSVTFANPATGFAVGKSGTLLRTTDGGATWQKIDSGTSATLNCIYITQDQGEFIGFIGCSDGNILKSTDWGVTWQPVKISQNRGHAIFAITRTKDGGFLAAGANSDVYCAQYPGKWWYSSVSYPRRWNCLRGGASSETTTVLVGANGYIALYTDKPQQVQSPAGITHLYDVELKGSVGYICGESGTILKTINGGDNWQKLTTGFDARLTSLSMLDENTVCAVGDEGTVLFTYDGGTTWTRRNIDTAAGFTSVCFSSPTSGYIVGDRGVTAVTTDGGVNWKTSLPVWSEKYVDVSFANPNVGWVLDRNGNLINTVDGGQSWNLRIPSSSRKVNAVHAASPELAYVCGSGGMVLRTTTGGLKWTSVETNSQADINSIAGFVDGPIIAVGSQGTIFRSPGIGLKMKASPSGVTSDLLDICMMDPLNGWIVGRDGVILRTVDGGTTWTQVPFQFPTWLNPGFALHAVTAQGPNVVIYGQGTKTTGTNPPVVSDVPFILSSTGMGTSWQFTYTGVPALSDLSLTAGGRLLGVGEGCTISTSSVNGTSWLAILLDGNFQLSALSFIGNIGYAVGDNGCILRSLDGGTTWQRIRYRPGGELHGMAFADDLYGWVAGDNGVVLRTADGGANWKPIDTGWNPVFKAIDCFGQDYAWMISGNCLYSTADAGAHWNRTQIKQNGVQTPISHELSCVDFISPDIGWLGARGGSVFSTADGGYSWQGSNVGSGPYDQPDNPALRIKKEVRSLSFVNPTTGWATGANGLLARTTDGGQYWTVQKDPASRTYNDVVGTSINTMYHGRYIRIAVGDHGLLRVTTQGMFQFISGLWDTIDIGTWSNLNAAACTSYGDVLVAGDNGTILATRYITGMGPLPLWHKIESWVSENLNAAVFDGPGIGFVFGDNGVILRYNGLNSPCTVLQTGIGADFRGACAASSYGPTYVCGTNGVVIMSNDHGTNWTDRSVDTQTALNSIAEYQSKLITVGDGGAIFVDTGSGWQARPSPTSANLTDVAISDGICYVVGDNGTMLVGNPFTGSEWTLLQTGIQADLKSVSMDGFFTRCLVAGADSTALQMNIPVNLTKPLCFSIGLDDMHDYNAVHFIDSLHGWAVGDNGRIISTQDGGENWTWKFTGLNSSLKVIKMLDSMRGIAAGDDGVVLVTTDAGVNWTLTDAGTADDILCIGAGQTKAWIAGENGTMVVGY